MRSAQQTRLAVRLSGMGLFDLANRAMRGASKDEIKAELRKLPAAVGMPIFKEIDIGEYDERDERQKTLWNG